MSKKKIEYHKRAFLNKATGLASVQCSVESWNSGYGLDATIDIHDCHRSVSLDFSAYGIKDLPVAFNKLVRFADQINEMVTFYADNFDAIKEDMENKEAERKANRKKYKRKNFADLVEELNDDKDSK